jgi:Fe2+ or Zn2+ uptake regulation protein
MTLSDEILRGSGHKLTPQRYMILRVIEEAQEHLCIEQIVQRVQKRNPQVSQATIYRNLSLLQEVGLIYPTHFPGKPLCYEMVWEREHHHFICKRCQIILHLDHTLLTHFFEHLQRQYHLYELRLELLATGYCDSCWQILQQEQGARTNGSLSDGGTHQPLMHP